MGRGIGIAAASLALFLGVVSPASAAEEIGDRCVADDAEAGRTMIGLNNGVNGPFPPNVVNPYGGVITRWKSELKPGTGPIQQRLVALQQVAEEDDRKIGESAIETLVDGANEFTTRIPVPPYAHIGLHGPVETLFCDKLKEHLAGIVNDPFALGEVRHFKVEIGTGVPAIAIVEPDRDADGYGDETQDRCGRLAWTQGDCPVIKISAGHAKVRKGSILIAASFESTTALPAPARVQASGEVGWKGRAKPVAFDGGTQDIAAGSATTFLLPLPKAVKRKLARMTPKESLRATIRAEVTNANELTGSGLRSAFTVKLPGRKKPAPKP